MVRNRVMLLRGLPYPVIIHLSEDTDIMEEGCLSVPGVNADVERPKEAVVRGTTRNGRMVEITAGGLLARVLQHEIDHLDGVLFIDRLSPILKLTIKDPLSMLEAQFATDRGHGFIPSDEEIARRLAALEAERT